MIVRLMGEGQFRLDDQAIDGLNQLDNQATQAVDGGDEENLHRLLKMMADAVREKGEKLDDADLSPSDLFIPPDDLTMEEAKELFSGEGLIPDLPVQS